MRTIAVPFLLIALPPTGDASADPPLVPMHGTVDGVVCLETADTGSGSTIAFRHADAGLQSPCSCCREWTGTASSTDASIAVNPDPDHGWLVLAVGDREWEILASGCPEFADCVRVLEPATRVPGETWGVFMLRGPLVLGCVADDPDLVLVPPTALVFRFEGEPAYAVSAEE